MRHCLRQALSCQPDLHMRQDLYTLHKAGSRALQQNCNCVVMCSQAACHGASALEHVISIADQGQAAIAAWLAADPAGNKEAVASAKRALTIPDPFPPPAEAAARQAWMQVMTDGRSSWSSPICKQLCLPLQTKWCSPVNGLPIFMMSCSTLKPHMPLPG